jgi:hypothetical protein
MIKQYEGINQVLINEIKQEFETKIFLESNGFKVKRGQESKNYKNIDLQKVLKQLHKSNIVFCVYDSRLIKCKVVQINEGTYRIYYKFNDKISLCFQEKFSYFEDNEDKNFTLKKYYTLGHYSYSTAKHKDIFGNDFIGFVI